MKLIRVGFFMLFLTLVAMAGNLNRNGGIKAVPGTWIDNTYSKKIKGRHLMDDGDVSWGISSPH